MLLDDAEGKIFMDFFVLFFVVIFMLFSAYLVLPCQIDESYVWVIPYLDTS